MGWQHPDMGTLMNTVSSLRQRRFEDLYETQKLEVLA
jgi:hypothetical protein